jgi:hypothetical protein
MIFSYLFLSSILLIESFVYNYLNSLYRQPDEEQAEFMRRTASHIASSPNPTQLEMRILTNYGSDPRFAFLKGRWARSWRAIQARNRMQKENEEKVSRGNKNENGTSLGGGLNGLDAYGSDEE